MELQCFAYGIRLPDPGSGSESDKAVGLPVAPEDKLMKTQGEFKSIMMLKGMGEAWAIKEFQRRWALGPEGGYKTDLDPDCQLPRVSMYGDTKDTNFLQRQKVGEVPA